MSSDWRDAETRNTPEAYQAFLKRYPASSHERVARTRLLEARWARLRPTSDLDGLTALQADVDKEAKASPSLRPLSEQISARRAELTWDRLRGSSDAAALEAFLKAFPNAVASAEANDRLDDLTWDVATRQATSKAWRDYLKRFGSGRHADEARRRGEGPSWNEVRTGGDEAQLKEHVALFPQGATAAPAREALGEVLWRRAERDQNDLRPFREYLELIPGGSQAQGAQDAVDWALAEDDGTFKAVEQYLRRYPNGRFAERARGALPALRSGVPAKVASTVDTAVATIREQIRTSLERMTAKGPVDITGTAQVSGAAAAVYWQGGGMTAISRSQSPRRSDAGNDFSLACSFSGQIGPGGLTSLQITDKQRASLRLDGVSYVRTTEGWLSQIEKHFKER